MKDLNLLSPVCNSGYLSTELIRSIVQPIKMNNLAEPSKKVSTDMTACTIRTGWSGSFLSTNVARHIFAWWDLIIVNTRQFPSALEYFSL